MHLNIQIFEICPKAFGKLTWLSTTVQWNNKYWRKSKVDCFLHNIFLKGLKCLLCLPKLIAIIYEPLLPRISQLFIFNKQIPLSEQIHYCFHLSIVWSLNESHLCFQAYSCLQSHFKMFFHLMTIWKLSFFKINKPICLPTNMY